MEIQKIVNIELLKQGGFFFGREKVSGLRSL